MASSQNLIASLPEVNQLLFTFKQREGFSFQDIAKRLNRDEVYVAAIFYGQAVPSEDDAKALSNLVLEREVTQKQKNAFNAWISDLAHLSPVRGQLIQGVPDDPLLYRLYEAIKVYGYPIKHVVHEKLGDGIISAIDFTAKVETYADHGVDRVKLVFDGKWLPYKKW